MLLRSAFPTTATTQNSYLMSGYEAVGDYGAGAIYSRTGATSGGPMAIQDSNSVWFNLVIVDRTINVCHWGVKPDGTPSFELLTVANDYLKSLGGGGKVYFPGGGHYYWDYPNDSLDVGSNIEYCGDGYSSHFESAGSCFRHYPENMHPGNIGAMTYYSISDIAVGDQQVTCLTAAQAANFAPGDMLFVGSATMIFNTDTANPVKTFHELNEVVAVNSTTGVITLKRAICDKCTDAPQIANFHDDVSKGCTFRNLRLTSGYVPFFINGAYDWVIENCWITGRGAGISMNGPTHGVIRNNHFDIIVNNTYTFVTAVEVKLSAHNSVIENNVFVFQSSDGTWPTGNVVCGSYGESVRRIIDRNNSFIAPGQTVSGLGVGLAQGITWKDHYIQAHNMPLLVQMYVFEGARTVPVDQSDTDDIPCLIENIVLDLTGTVASGLDFLNKSNLTIRNITCNAAIAADALKMNTYWSDPIAHTIKNVLIENVHLNGPVNVLDENLQEYSNVVIKGCSFTTTSFPSHMANNIVFEDVRVYGTDIPAGGVLTNGTSATPDVAGISIYQPTDTTVTITNFLNGVDGQSLYVVGRSGSTITIANGTNIKTTTGSNKSLAANRIYQFKLTGSTWIEVG